MLIATWTALSMTLMGPLKRLMKIGATYGVDPVYAIAFEGANVGLVLVAVDGKIQHANAAFCAMVGRDAAEIRGLGWEWLLAKQGWRQVETPADRPVASNQLDANYAHLTRTGEPAIARVFSVALGEPPLVLTTVEDITERRSTEAALRESEERLQLALRGADEGLFDWRIPENTVYRSPRFLSMLGYEAAEVAKDASFFLSIAAPGVRAAMDEHMSRLEAGEIDIYELEMQLRHKDGHWLDILSRGYPQFDDNRKIVRIVGTHLDITQRKLQEAELRLAATVFANAHEGIVVTDFARRIQIANPAFEALTGYSAVELKGQNISLLNSGRHDAAFYEEIQTKIARSGRWRGEVWNRLKGGRVMPSWATISLLLDAHGEPAGYVAMYSDISDFKKSQARLEFLALHDAETRLPNEAALRQRIQAGLDSLRNRDGGSALFHMDLDRLRAIVESLGHATGDELVAQAIERFAAKLAPRDMLARIGPAELSLLRDDCATPEEARMFANELSGTMAAPFVFASGANAYCGVDIGLIWFTHGQGEAEILMRQAKSALYVAKTRGGGMRAFEPRHMVEARERLEMEVGLRLALERNELALQFQPLVDLEGSRTFGVEALVRWRTPEGVTPPGKFIPLAEKTGLIVLIGEWVLRRAAERMKAWLDAGVMLDTISINLSPRQFERPDLVDTVTSILAETGLPFDKVELEITESVLMNQKNAVAKLRQLRALGLRIAIDDFGTGHSSLAYLKNFPIDKLKLDRAFIMDLPADDAGMQIAAAVIRLGHSLGLTVLAEGVETEAQADFLASAGCRYAQGFLFAKPLWEEELLAFLAHSQSVAA